ncbi:MAG TPA: polyphenol oxidase family protein [Methylomirabilota bacterium]|nr:polyphenol oxidase family protein [Methylomirabilota bacterium]
MISEGTTRLVPFGEPVTHFRFSGLAALGLPHVTTTRYFPGVSSPSEPTAPFTAAAQRALRAAGLDPARVSYARQVHGAEVLRAPRGGGYAGAGDVLVTTERDVPLAIFTADCLALTLWDSIARVLVLAHVGWRGTVKGATVAAVRAAVEAGARAEQLHVAIAPAIGPCCYEVDEPVMREFGRAHGRRAQAWFTPPRDGHARLDLWAANEALLAGAGVDPRQIENPRLCTACHPELLYSYRKGNRGRLVTVAALP